MWDTRTSTSNTRTILIALLGINCRSCWKAELTSSVFAGLTFLPCLQAETSRDNKLLGVFTIVNFPNTACNVSSSNTVGVCYTPIECQALGGTASATCASGFGVCCTFSGKIWPGRAGMTELLCSPVWGDDLAQQHILRQPHQRGQLALQPHGVQGQHQHLSDQAGLRDLQH